MMKSKESIKSSIFCKCGIIKDPKVQTSCNFCDVKKNLAKYEEKAIPPFVQDEIDPYNYIKDNIFLGNFRVREDKALLQSLKITHILMCAGDLEMDPPKDFIYKELNIIDEWDQNIFPLFEDANNFINSSKAGNIFVHCAAGLSRSPSFVMAYFISQGRSFSEAFEIVREKRPKIWPNIGFVAQLKDYSNSCMYKSTKNKNTIKQIKKK